MVTSWSAIPPILDATQTAAIALLNAQLTDGSVRYVDSNSSGGAVAGFSPGDAYATINLAQNASAVGDTIIVAEGHAEDIAGNTSLVMDTVGVKVIGLGHGSRRPALTMTATAAEIIFSAADVQFSNMLITVTTAGTIDCVVAATLSATDILLSNLEFRQLAADAEFVDAIILAAGANRAKLDGLRFDHVTNGGANQSAVNSPVALTGVEITNFYANGKFAQGAIQNETAGMLDTRMANITVRQLHATQDGCIVMHGDATGFIDKARLRTVGTDDAALTGAIVAAKFQLYDIGLVNADGESAAIGEVSDLDVTNTRSGQTFSSIA